MAAPDLRPLSLGELLDRTFSIYRSNFWLFAGIMVVPQLVILAVAIGWTALTSGGGTSGQIGAQFAAGLVAIPLFIIAFFVAYGAAQAAVTFAVSDLYLGRSTSVRSAYLRVRGKIGRSVSIIFLLYLLIVGGLILFIIPGIWVALHTAVVIPVAMIENLGARAAIRRSIGLIRGGAGRPFLIFVLVMFIAMVASFMFTLPGTIFAVMYAKQPGALIWITQLNHLASFVSGVLVGPIGIIAFVLFYYDRRVRKEAFDLELMMADLDRGSVAAGSPPA